METMAFECTVCPLCTVCTLYIVSNVYTVPVVSNVYNGYLLDTIDTLYTVVTGHSMSIKSNGVITTKFNGVHYVECVQWLDTINLYFPIYLM